VVDRCARLRPDPTLCPSFALIFTDVFGWTQGEKKSALSLGESVASQVSGYLVMLAHLILCVHATDPSPGPRRLMKALVAGHPPQGRGLGLWPFED
jgi:hypothetical protein